MSSDQKPQPQRTETDQAANASVLSFGSELTLTASSTTPLRKSSRKPKDYEAALGVLQSRYGMGGDIPSPKKEPSTKLPRHKQPADHEGAGGSLSAPPTTSTTAIGGSPSSSLKQTISRSSRGSSNSSEGKKKYSLLRLFKEKKKKEMEGMGGGESQTGKQGKGNED